MQERGRHPPPHFDKWFEFASSHGCVIIEDLFDQIYRDIDPFWVRTLLISELQLRPFPNLSAFEMARSKNLRVIHTCFMLISICFRRSRLFCQMSTFLSTQWTSHEYWFRGKMSMTWFRAVSRAGTCNVCLRCALSIHLTTKHGPLNTCGFIKHLFGTS